MFLLLSMGIGLVWWSWIDNLREKFGDFADYASCKTQVLDFSQRKRKVNCTLFPSFT